MTCLLMHLQFWPQFWLPMHLLDLAISFHVPQNQLQWALHWRPQFLYHSCFWVVIFWTISETYFTLLNLHYLVSFFYYLRSIPFFMVWIKYISWFYYGNEILISNQWRNVENISCLTFSGSVGSEPESCIKHGRAVIELFSYDSNNIIFDLIMLELLIFFLRVFSFIVLYVRVNMLR